MYRIYFARCMNIFNSLLAQLVKYDVHTTRKINSIHAIFLSHIIIIWTYYKETHCNCHRTLMTFSRSLIQRSKSGSDGRRIWWTWELLNHRTDFNQNLQKYMYFPQWRYELTRFPRSGHGFIVQRQGHRNVFRQRPRGRRFAVEDQLHSVVAQLHVPS